MASFSDTSNLAEINVGAPDARTASTARIVIDHAQVRSYERIMAELLLASRMNRAKRLSHPAAGALSQTGHDSTVEGFMATALELRRKCVELGMPECRYRDTDWRLRGL
jgi:hypothetical protein